MTSHLHQPGVFDLIAQSGWVAKFVLLILLFASVVCWGIIIAKWKTLKTVRSQNEKFLNIFWNGKNIDEILAKTDKFSHSPLSNAFKYAVRELKKVSSPDSQITQSSEKIENIQRALARAASSEIAGLEKYVNWLATTASAAPFIGLFGTVWGIMNSFQSIGASGAANLAVVAPGISEALITTATGIAAAIPAVVAYNSLVGQIKKVAIDLECFGQDFTNIIQRSLVSSKK